MGVSSPTHSRHGLDGKDGDTVGQDGESVLLILEIEDLEARNGDDASGETVLLLESLSGVDAERDFGTGGDEGDSCVLNLVGDVAATKSLLDGGVLQLRQVLTSQCEDGRSVLGSDGRVISGRSLITVSGAPDHAVRQSAEVSEGLDGLVSRTVLTETDGVVGSDVDGADLREGRETDCTGGVGDEVEESTGCGDDTAISSKTVHDSGHGVLADTVAEVAARPVTETGGRGLEVNGLSPAGVVGAGQVSRAGEKLGNSLVDLLEDGLGELARGNGGVGGGVAGQALLPTLGELTGKATSELSGLGGVLGGVLLEESVPLGLLLSTFLSVLSVEVIDVLADVEGLLRVEAEERLDLLDVVGLEGVAVDTVGALEEGTETDGGGKLDDGRLVGDLLALLNGGGNGLKVVVTVLDPDGVPAVSLETLHDVLSESDLGVTICFSMS